MSWQTKAHKIIGDLCMESYLQANPKAMKFHDKYGAFTPVKRHNPYSVPLLAEQLINCLNQDDEETAKAIFIRLAVIKH